MMDIYFGTIRRFNGGDEMVDPERYKYLSETEVKRFDALANFDTVKAAAKSLGIAESTLSNWKSAIKKRYRKRRGWINSVLAQRNRGGSLANLLNERNKMAPPDSEDLDEEF